MQILTHPYVPATVGRTIEGLQKLADKGGMPPCEGPRNPHWLGSALRWCQRNELTSDEARLLVEARLTRPAQPGEIERMASKVYSTDIEAQPRATRWPPRDDERLETLWREHPARVAEVIAASPIPVSQLPIPPINILGWLHAPGALIYLSHRKAVVGETKTLAEWQMDTGDISKWAMCVPNAMSKRVGTNGEGATSVRCRDTSCGFDGMLYAVAEPDFDDTVPLVQAGVNAQDLCASVILHRIPRERIVMIVDSAGKSLHAWLNVAGFSKSQREGFFQTGCLYGVDPAGRLPEQQFRLPNGTRWIQTNGGEAAAIQQVLYFNPQAL